MIKTPIDDISAGNPLYPRMELDEARAWLREAVDTQGPEFVYMRRGYDGGCSYFPRVSPYVDEAISVDDGDARRTTPCLIGVAIRLAGREVFPYMEGRTPLEHRIPWNISLEAAQYFTVAQQIQDQGGTWGQALERAESAFPRMALKSGVSV